MPRTCFTAQGSTLRLCAPNCGWKLASRWLVWSFAPRAGRRRQRQRRRSLKSERSMARAMEIVTPLGDDVLLFHRMRAHEELGRISEFQLELLSARGDINLDQIL